jgi:ribosomal protein S18 acetylase RimI-like enzyme
MMEAEPVRLRDSYRSDFESMWELDQDCFPRGISYSKSELRAFLSQKTAETIVAEREGRLVAFVLGSRRNRTNGHVITLDVAAAARRQGVGRQLMVELERRFRAAGVKQVQLESAVTNMVAIAFYQRLGYRMVAHLANYYGPGLHAWKMEKALDGTANPQQEPRIS